MGESATVLAQAVKAKQTGAAELPNAKDLVVALQATEKSTKASYAWGDLVGIWRLWFITGTKKTRQKAGVALGAGRYLPKLFKIQLEYQASSDDRGDVHNNVSLRQLTLTLTGPVKYRPKARCLAFDFTQIQVAIGRLTLYQGRIKPQAADEMFYQQPLKEQAFFKYFWVPEPGIAAGG